MRGGRHGGWGHGGHNPWAGAGHTVGSDAQPQNGNPIGQFMQNMFQNMQNGNGGCGKQWGGNNGKWKENKAQLISSPKDTLCGSPGEIIFAHVEIKNGMNWPWKPQASLISNYSVETAMLLDEVAIPIDFPVEAGQQFSLSIPLKIKDSALISAPNQEHQAQVGFVGKKGCPFGVPIVVKFRVVKKIDEVELYQNAIELFENAKDETTWDETVEVLKKTGNDKNLAREILMQKRQAKIDLVTSQFMTNRDDEDDLYS